ncbi:hypothetical protein D9M68_694940 [compost metagenome]
MRIFIQIEFRINHHEVYFLFEVFIRHILCVSKILPSSNNYRQNLQFDQLFYHRFNGIIRIRYFIAGHNVTEVNDFTVKSPFIQYIKLLPEIVRPQ